MEGGPNVAKGKDTSKKVKDANLNVKLPEDDYREIQEIADSLGGLTISSMIRTLIYAQLDKVRKSGDPRLFLDVLSKK